jgi:hypothetical protein
MLQMFEGYTDTNDKMIHFVVPGKLVISKKYS